MEKPAAKRGIFEAPYQLTADQIAFYQENRYLKLKQVLPPEALQQYAEVIHDKVKELNTMHLPLEERDTYSKAFLQVMNLWRKSEKIKRLVFSKRLARIEREVDARRHPAVEVVEREHARAYPSSWAGRTLLRRAGRPVASVPARSTYIARNAVHTPVFPNRERSARSSAT